MRTMILAAALAVASTASFAQIYPPGQKTYPTSPSALPPPSQQYQQYPSQQYPSQYQQPSQTYQQPSQRTATSGQENCGTPDDFKACPPLPRRALPDYPPNRPVCGSCKVPD